VNTFTKSQVRVIINSVTKTTLKSYNVFASRTVQPSYDPQEDYDYVTQVQVLACDSETAEIKAKDLLDDNYDWDTWVE
jgi:hypothetical protein